MMIAERLPSWAGVRDALVRGVKLTLAMSVAGFVLAFVAWGYRLTPGTESALWQGGAFVGFLLLAGVLHRRYRAGENLALAYAWAGLLAFWLVAIAGFLIQAHWPEVLA